MLFQEPSRQPGVFFVCLCEENLNVAKRLTVEKL